ncbi:hypothetical protein L873DRAFT_1857720 [Choiromyces venosus 120613-1]|uniref:Uncharacterized protein n=1 Tax=Choiromyces venosus 120613-1 TaxID=1336337 RepID=A0A3N4J3N3_9PEZI|nr:hypothetical protein L873DRAFT_1857720 [Choiromyces venosus 120613-1]
MRKPSLRYKYTSNMNCCAHVLLSSQLDFQAQKGELQETIKAAGPLLGSPMRSLLLYNHATCNNNILDISRGNKYSESYLLIIT